MHIRHFFAVSLTTLCLSAIPCTIPVSAGETASGPGIETGHNTSSAEDAKPAGPGSAAGSPAPSQDLPPLVPEGSPNYYQLPLSVPIVPEHLMYTYVQMCQDLTALQQLYGSHMKLDSLGKTWDGRDIHHVIVGNPDAPKQILIQGGIHGREYITSQLIMKQLEYVLAFYDGGVLNGQWLSQILEQTAVHFVPMVNPDGVSISQWQANGISTEYLQQSLHLYHEADGFGSSCGSYLTLWKSNGRGVDLNHNFAAGWQFVDSPGHPSSRDYKGENPLSEPESMALAGLVEQYPIKMCLNYHARGQVIYWDVEGNQQREASRQLARIFSQATGYRISNELGIGGFKDWLQIKDNPIPSITLEVGVNSCPVPQYEFPAIWTQNHSAVALALIYSSALP